MVQGLLPGAPNAVAQAPQVKVGADAFNRAPEFVPRVGEQGIGEGLEAIGAGMSDLAVPLAKQAAADEVAKAHDPNTAVTLNPDGTPQAVRPGNSFIVGRAGEAYQAATLAGARTDLSAAVTQKMADIRAQNPTDAKAFSTGAANYAEQLRQTYPGDLGNQLAAEAHSQGAQHYGNMIEANARRDTQVSLQSITTGIDDTKNKMSALARQGANNTPVYADLQNKLLAGYDQLGTNPLFGFGPEKVASEKQRATDDLRAEYVVGQVDQAFHRGSGDSGRAGAQKMLEDQILNNPNLNLSDAERKQAYAWGMSRLSYLTDAQRADIAASKATTESLISAYSKNPASVPDALYDTAVDKARTVGDAEGAGKLQAARMSSLMTRPTAGMTDEQRFNTLVGGGTGGSEKTALDFFQKQGWSPVQASGIVGNLARESRLNPGATNRGDGADGSDSIGIGQWNAERAQALRAFASARGKPVNDYQTQLEFVQHELTTSEGNAANMLRGAKTPEEAAAAFALGYERPKGFMTGDIKQVSGGSDRVANALRLAGGGASSAPIVPSANGVPFTADQLRQNPILMSAYAHSIASNAENVTTLGKSIGGALETQVKAGLPPDQTTLANYFQIAAQHPDTFGEQSQKIQASIIANAGTTGASSPVAAQAFVEQTKALAESSPSIFHAQIAEAAQGALTRQSEALKTDPFGESARRGWIGRAPAPLDFSSADGLTHGMAERGQAAIRIADHTGVSGTSAIAPAEVPAIKSLMTSGTLDQRGALLGAITGAGMPEPVLKATLGALASDKQTLPLAVAGSLARNNPDAARGILEGQAIMQAEPKFAPNKDDFPTELAKAIPFNDLPNTTAREGIAGAVQAYYAKLSAAAGDTTGIINDDRMKASVSAVTGGVVTYRGSSAIAPWYGAGQGGMDGAIRTLTDADFAGARTTNGEPFPASTLKPSLMGSLTWNNWRLQSAGDGKYLVFSGADDKRQYLSNSQNGKFILDLGAKRAQAEQADAGPMSKIADLPFAGLLGGWPVGGPM